MILEPKKIKSVTVSIVVKQKMIRVSIDILGISKLKWRGMGEFNSDDHYIYYCGQESPSQDEAASSTHVRAGATV